MKYLSRGADSVPYVTLDGSQIRELMHPYGHGSRAQSLAEARVPVGEAAYSSGVLSCSPRSYTTCARPTSNLSTGPMRSTSLLG